MISGILAVQNGINCSSFCLFDGECARSVALAHFGYGQFLECSFLCGDTSSVYCVVHVVSIIKFI